jgi:hypothetical protein
VTPWSRGEGAVDVKPRVLIFVSWYRWFVSCGLHSVDFGAKWLTGGLERRMRKPRNPSGRGEKVKNCAIPGERKACLPDSIQTHSRLPCRCRFTKFVVGRNEMDLTFWCIVSAMCTYVPLPWTVIYILGTHRGFSLNSCFFVLRMQCVFCDGESEILNISYITYVIRIIYNSINKLIFIIQHKPKKYTFYKLIF